MASTPVTRTRIATTAACSRRTASKADPFAAETVAAHLQVDQRADARGGRIADIAAHDSRRQEGHRRRSTSTLRRLRYEHGAGTRTGSDGAIRHPHSILANRGPGLCSGHPARSISQYLRENRDAFASRLSVPFSYCLAATRGGELIGYVLSHGWPRRNPPVVGTVLVDDQETEVLFIHDLATASAARGSGIGRILVERALAYAFADGFRDAELVAVEGAASFWRTLGFAKPTISAELGAKVGSYGSRAAWMERKISG